MFYYTLAVKLIARYCTVCVKYKKESNKEGEISNSATYLQ